MDKDTLQNQRDEYIKRVAETITKKNTPKASQAKLSSSSFSASQITESQRRSFMRSFQQYPIATGYYQKLAETRRIPHQTLVERTVQPNY